MTITKSLQKMADEYTFCSIDLRSNRLQISQAGALETDAFDSNYCSSWEIMTHPTLPHRHSSYSCQTIPTLLCSFIRMESHCFLIQRTIYQGSMQKGF